ncbi:MAG: MinD/ParA family ATP-binding protein [Candidatus Kariarchaeaceae archaeon]|jgi:septum site-determining protein MinD
MTKVLVVHSHKGGSGKTSTAINLAAIFASKGKTVVVIDLDLNAPSLQTFAPGRQENSINDLFLGNCEFEDIVFNASYLLGSNPKGKLFLALADISGERISEMGQRSKEDLLNDLYLLMGIIRNQLPNSPWNADYIIIDTPPGLSTTSINGVATADHLILLLRLVNADINGTYHFMKTIHKALRPTTSLVVNQVPKSFLDTGGLERTEELIQKRIIQHIGRSNVNLLGVIQHDETLINTELEYAFSEMNKPMENHPRPIHFLENPESSFSISLKEIAEKLME